MNVDYSKFQKKFDSRTIDCKTVGFFFSKSVKKSGKRGLRVLRARSARALHTAERVKREKTNPNSCEQIQASTSVILQRKLQQFITVGNIANDLLKTLLDSLVTACIEIQPLGIARGWEKRVIRTNITYAKRTVRIFSVSPQSFSLCFKPRSRPFV